MVEGGDQVGEELADRLGLMGREELAELAVFGVATGALETLEERSFVAEGDALGFLGVEACEFSGPAAGVFFAAESIDESEVKGLLAGKNSTIGEAADGVFGEVASLGDDLDELTVGAVDEVLEDLLFWFGELAIEGEDVFVGTGFDHFEGDADAIEEAFEVVAPENDTDTAGDGAGVAHDVGSPHADVDAAGGGDIAVAGDDFDFALELLEGAVDFVGIDDGAAGAVDAEEEGGVFAFFDEFEGLENAGSGCAGNGAVDLEASDLFAVTTEGPDHGLPGLLRMLRDSRDLRDGDGGDGRED